MGPACLQRVHITPAFSGYPKIPIRWRGVARLTVLRGVDWGGLIDTLCLFVAPVDWHMRWSANTEGDAFGRTRARLANIVRAATGINGRRRLKQQRPREGRAGGRRGGGGTNAVRSWLERYMLLTGKYGMQNERRDGNQWQGGTCLADCFNEGNQQDRINFRRAGFRLRWLAQHRRSRRSNTQHCAAR